MSRDAARDALPVLIARGEGLRYPEPDDAFSPGERYPEYAHAALARAANPVYAALRGMFAAAGLDAERCGTPDWNPLGAFVPRGARVFVLCNFVYHRRPAETQEAFFAKCIHGSVLRALVDYALLAVGPEGRVRFGNAPLQSCDWERVQEETGARRVERFYAEQGLSVEARDLRLLVRPRSGLGRSDAISRRSESAACEIDLAGASLLEEIGAARGRAARFRVCDYDPRRTQGFHSQGRHRYLLHRELLESDVVISLSKLKTHEKVGITCGLKGFVGAVAHKDSLAHHRFGSPAVGGDEYPARHRFLQPLSALHDWVYSREPEAALQPCFESADRILRTLARKSGAVTSGAWWGNDTAWRMALDLARILYHADARGALQPAPQRRHLSLIDGIVAGEGNGPLDPTPVAAGALIFSDDVAAADRVACRLLGFAPERIPLVQQALADPRLGISRFRAGDAIPCLDNGRACDDRALEPCLGRAFRPSEGWLPRLGAG